MANGLAGAWALGAHFKTELRVAALWWFTGFAQALAFVQASVGVALLSSEDLEPDDFHMLYGFSTLVAVGILYSYRGQIPQHKYTLYAGGGFFIMGLGIREMFL